MSIVTEQVVRVLRAGLAEEVDRQERENNARGPEPEQRVVVTRTVLPVGPGWEAREQRVLPSRLPSGFTAVVALGADELRVRALMISAIRRWGWGR
ncbi:hypothetical protein OG285_38450 [Streptomyces sp. NBC_01471]|uniref:hypothetical protein n=1 Tax=Streptomyces sp. NBC_01471 TaxID=2903879 RepID=UPI003252F3DA